MTYGARCRTWERRARIPASVTITRFGKTIGGCPGLTARIDRRDLWSRQVLGIPDGYWRVVASAEAMMEKAAQIGQKWLKGIGFARSLAENR